ncbi:MAG: LAGLIDADG family homing endonuclease [Nanoarchaeota archaeon]|nr:LAGLIDADG family homing endonuclease [Nanoarchaeota archaeon]
MIGQIKVGIKNNFNLLREKYGNLLIDFYKQKIKSSQWSELITKNFNEREISFLLGINIKDSIINIFNQNLEDIDLGKGAKLKFTGDSYRLVISPEKAALLTWICTDGYLEISKRGYYIRVRDEEKELLYSFIKILREVYGEVKANVSKIKDKNAYEARICSKEIISDVVTYIPLSTTREWTIPIEILDNKGIKSVLRILTQTEGCIFEQNRTRMIEITLANLQVLNQAKSLFESINIQTKEIREDFSGGHQRYKLGISKRENLHKFKEIVGFIPHSKKWYKLQAILDNYKEFHSTDIDQIIFDIVKNNPMISTKDIIKNGKLDRSSTSRNIKKLRNIGKIDYKRGKGNTRLWYSNY